MNNTTINNTTPLGYNRRLRNVTKILLVPACCSLVFDTARTWTVVLAALACLSVKKGKRTSRKNAKWLIISAVTFLVSLVSFVLLSAAKMLDEEKSYDRRTQLFLFGWSSQKIWGGILALLLVSAFAPDESVDEQRMVNSSPSSTTKKAQ